MNKTLSVKVYIFLFLFGVFVISFLNMMFFHFEIGGGALNGCIENDEYFVGDRGEFKKVSEGTFNKSLRNEIFTLVSGASVFLFSIFAKIDKRKSGD